MFSWISNNLPWPARLIFLGALICAAGALLDWPALPIFIGALISAVGAVWAAKQKVVSERELKQKNEEIAQLSRQIAQSVTGGDSYCYLAFSLPEENGTSSLLTAVHQGQYPLYDVSIRLVDLDKFDEVIAKPQISLEDVPGKVFTIGNLSKGQALVLARLGLPTGGQARYNIFISARNGFVTELVRLKRINKKWVSAYKVFKAEAAPGGSQGILYEKIDPDFPRNMQGEIEW